MRLVVGERDRQCLWEVGTWWGRLVVFVEVAER